jgi:hypothetical protein
MMAQRRTTHQDEQEQAELWRRQFERNYLAHLRGTTQEKRWARQQRVRSRRYARYFWRVLALMLVGLSIVFGAQAAESIQPEASAFAERCRAWAYEKGLVGG